MFHVSLDCRNVDIGVGRRVGPCVYVCEREAEGTAELTTNAKRRLIAVGGFGDLHKKGNLRLGRSRRHRRRRHNAASERRHYERDGAFSTNLGSRA